MSEQIFSEDLRSAARKAISLNIPFALYALPGDTEFKFLASEPDDEGNAIDITDPSLQAFVINGFANSVNSAIGIRPRMTAADILNLPDDYSPFDGSYKLTMGITTPYWHYVANVRELQRHIRQSVRKVVFSRKINVEIKADAVSLAEEYFGSLPNTFRAMYFTQETGLWITATPEHLLRYDAAKSEYSTMALAGTRRTEQLEWDEKNTLEHDLVLQQIVDTFRHFKLECEVSQPALIEFGKVAHYCHYLRAKGDVNPWLIVDSLDPTPAICGLPTNKALSLINRFEPYARNCYGGFIGLKNGENIDLYVNLRCAMLIQHNENLKVSIISGGGIMKASIPDNEWIEAGMKALPLWEAIMRMTPEDVNGDMLVDYQITTGDVLPELPL